MCKSKVLLAHIDSSFTDSLIRYLNFHFKKDVIIANRVKLCSIIFKNAYNQLHKRFCPRIYSSLSSSVIYIHTYLFMYALKLNKYLAKVQFVTLKTMAEMRQIDLKMENSGNLSMKKLFRS